MSNEPLEPPNEQRWWEMQLGLRLPRSLRHPSPIVRLDSHAEDVATHEKPDPAAASPPDEREWWEKQVGKQVRGD